MKKQIILTGVSGSGKTSVMNKLIEKFPSSTGQPIQYTTRKPRNDGELDEYVFLTKEQFYIKLENGDFIEFTEYNGNFYAVGKFFNQELSNVFIVEPAGRAMLKKWFLLNDIPFLSFYIELPKEEARGRMINRGDTIQQIEARLSDYKYFAREENDILLDGEMSTLHNMARIATSCSLLAF